ncbi:hypothetical protein EJB05_26750, partial [Eragrostis curvula]
ISTEALSSASLGAMGSLLEKLDNLLPTENGADSFRQLREDVGSISTKLVKLSGVQDPPLTVSYWIKDVRQLSYDMEDCVDQFIHAKADTKMDLIDVILGFRTRAEEVRERYNRFNLGYFLSRPTNTVVSHHLQTVYWEHKFVITVGMEGPRNEVTGWLQSNGDDEKELQLGVVSVLGVDGVVWDALSRAFPEGYCCSRIITTTTIENAALACCSYGPEHIFRMKPLSGDNSKELFIRTVFGPGKDCPQQFRYVTDEISRKCGGLPLAIICIANSTSEEVLKQVLKLCYSSLPHCLKTCLLYLCIYPENYIILKEDLVNQWLAEGFISTVEGKDTVEVAMRYFDEILGMGLIQPLDINSKKKTLS